MCPRSRGDYDQGQPVSSKGGKGKEEGFITGFRIFLPLHYRFFRSKRNRPFDTRVSISLCNCDKRLSRLAVHVEREGGGGARRGGIGSRPIGAKVLKRFGLERWVSRATEIYFRFRWGFSTGEIRGNGNSINAFDATWHKGRASRWLRLVLFSSMTLLRLLTAFNEIRRDYLVGSVFTGARVFGQDIGHCLWGQLFVDGSLEAARRLRIGSPSNVSLNTA